MKLIWDARGSIALPSKLIEEAGRDDGMPHARDIFESTFMKVYETLVDFLKKASKQGVLREGTDPEVAATIIFGTLTHVARTDEMSKQYSGKSITDSKYRKRVVDQLTQIYLIGILAEASK